MDEDIDNFVNDDLESLIIKDKAYKRKKLIKILLIIVISLVIITIIFVAAYFIYISIENGNNGQITCLYITNHDNDTIVLINDDENLKFNLIINGHSFNQEYKHTFAEKGTQKVIFKFKRRIKSLANLFKDNGALKEADLSELVAKDITSLNKLFYNCVKLEKVKFIFKT